MGIELSNIRKFRIRKRVVMCYPGADIDFIKDSLEVVRRSRGVIIHVGKNRYITFEKSEILLKKYRELLVRAKEIGKKVCVSGILPRLDENEEWWSRVRGVNEREYMLCDSMNCIYLDVWENFADS